MIGIYPNDESLIRLAGTLLIEQNDEWLMGRRYLAPVRDPGALAGIIAGVLDHPEQAAAIGAAGRVAALELSWERNARLTLDAYERAVGSAP